MRFRQALVEEIIKVAARYPASRLTPQSSNVAGYRYDAGAKQLFVSFKGGSTYRYDDVPENVVRSLGRNKSVGKTFNRVVKGGGYTYEKVSAPAIAEHFYRQRRSIAKLAGAAKKQVTWNGVRLKIEYEPGDIREGVSKDGTKWQREMFASYGYVPGTKGMAADGDAIDIYLAKDPVDGPVFEIRQNKKDGAFDEQKFMLGWGSAEEAQRAYLRHMPGWAFGSISNYAQNAREFAEKIHATEKTAGIAEYSLMPSIEQQRSPTANPTPKAGFGSAPRPLANPAPTPKPPAPSTSTPKPLMSKRAMSSMLSELTKEAGLRDIIRRVVHGRPIEKPTGFFKRRRLAAMYGVKPSELDAVLERRRQRLRLGRAATVGGGLALGSLAAHGGDSHGTGTGPGPGGYNAPPPTSGPAFPKKRPPDPPRPVKPPPPKRTLTVAEGARPITTTKTTATPPPRQLPKDLP